MSRPELKRMLDSLRQGDVVIVLKLDRLARSTRDLLSICDHIAASKASFQSLSKSWANTTTTGGKMILAVFAGIAEFERDLIVERTSSGGKLLKKEGLNLGDP